MTEPLPTSRAAIVEQANAFAWDGHPLEPGVGLALSGGGFRAMLFHAGALMRLNELGILSAVARISSVSGGSIASGYLGYAWNQLGAPNDFGSFSGFRQKYVEPILGLSQQKIDVPDILTGLLPRTSAATQVADSYDKLPFSRIENRRSARQTRIAGRTSTSITSADACAT
jgi:NTE family protein